MPTAAMVRPMPRSRRLPRLRILNKFNNHRSPNYHALLTPSPSLPHPLSSRDSLDAVVHALLHSHAFCVTAIVGPKHLRPSWGVLGRY